MGNCDICCCCVWLGIVCLLLCWFGVMLVVCVIVVYVVLQFDGDIVLCWQVGVDGIGFWLGGDVDGFDVYVWMIDVELVCGVCNLLLSDGW